MKRQEYILLWVALLISSWVVWQGPRIESPPAPPPAVVAVQPAERHPPGKILVNGEIFKVVILGDQYMQNTWGMTYCYEHLILLNLNLDEFQSRDILTHELLHAITCKYGGSAKRYNSRSETGHEGIYFLSPKLADLLIHNPSLLRWYSDGDIIPEYLEDSSPKPALIFSTTPPPPEYAP